MKKMILWLLLAAVCLCGCGRKTASQTDALRQRYRDMQAAHMEAEITCHLETENRTFTVSCDWTPTGAGTTVTAPEALAGLTASVSGEDLTVSYDGAALSAGSLRDVAPANCLPWLLHAVAEGYLAEAGRERMGPTACVWPWTPPPPAARCCAPCGWTAAARRCMPSLPRTAAWC